MCFKKGMALDERAIRRKASPAGEGHVSDYP
jgi:hypothetical protein